MDIRKAIEKQLRRLMAKFTKQPENQKIKADIAGLQQKLCMPHLSSLSDGQHIQPVASIESVFKSQEPEAKKDISKRRRLADRKRMARKSRIAQTLRRFIHRKDRSDRALESQILADYGMSGLLPLVSVLQREFEATNAYQLIHVIEDILEHYGRGIDFKPFQQRLKDVILQAMPDERHMWEYWTHPRTHFEETLLEISREEHVNKYMDFEPLVMQRYNVTTRRDLAEIIIEEYHAQTEDIYYLQLGLSQFSNGIPTDYPYNVELCAWLYLFHVQLFQIYNCSTPWYEDETMPAPCFNMRFHRKINVSREDWDPEYKEQIEKGIAEHKATKELAAKRKAAYKAPDWLKRALQKNMAPEQKDPMPARKTGPPADWIERCNRTIDGGDEIRMEDYLKADNSKQSSKTRLFNLIKDANNPNKW